MVRDLPELPEMDEVEILEIEAVDETGAPILMAPQAHVPDPEPEPEPEPCAGCTEERSARARLLGEFENYRVRRDREALTARADGAADTLRDMLPILDDLERAIGALPRETPASVREGLCLMLSHLDVLMRQYGVEPVSGVGTSFDPAVHEAVSVIPSAGHADREVIEELRRGYTHNGRLLRPSLVSVAHNPESGEEPPPAPEEPPWVA